MSQTLFPLPLAPFSSRFSSNLSTNSNLLCPHSPIFSNPTFPQPLTFHSKLQISQPTFITPIRSQPMSHSSTNSNSAPIDNPRWSLRGMTALITSGTPGIGHATVEELVGFEARVHTCCRNESELDGCLSEWDNLGFGVTGTACDVSVQSQREELMSTMSTLFDGLGRNCHPYTILS